MKSKFHLMIKNPSLIVFIPWFLLAPLMIFVEIRKLDWKETKALAREDRQVHFLSVAMPYVDGDFFSILQKARSYIDNGGLQFALTGLNSMGEFPFRIARSYSLYHLRPATLTEDIDKADIIIALSKDEKLLTNYKQVDQEGSFLLFKKT